MRVLPALLLLGACAEHDAAPTPVTKPTIVETVDNLTLAQRLRDEPGPVAGLPFQIKRDVDRTHCDGFVITATPTGSTTEPIAPVFALRFPTGLDFSAANKSASITRFDKFVADMTGLGATARTTYMTTMTAKSSTMTERVIAAARIVQMERYIATMLVHAEIPLDVRTGEYADEKTTAFCDRMKEIAEPIVLTSEGAAKVCSDHAASVPRGWWTPVCSLTPPVVTASAARSSTR
jgi:hypothetical protein